MPLQHNYIARASGCTEVCKTLLSCGTIFKQSIPLRFTSPSPHLHKPFLRRCLTRQCQFPEWLILHPIGSACHNKLPLQTNSNKHNLFSFSFIKSAEYLMTTIYVDIFPDRFLLCDYTCYLSLQIAQYPWQSHQNPTA